MEIPRRGSAERAAHAPAVPGLGVLCPEAQADGVPCPELGRNCADCERARPYAEVNAPRRPAAQARWMDGQRPGGARR